MRHFKSGSFDRDKMHRSIRILSPSESLERLEDVDLELLWSTGKRLILLDVDNTLLPWRSHDVPEATMHWLEEGKELGFRFCVLSNTRNPERLEKLVKLMGIEYIRDKFKPSTRMYVLALEKYQFNPEQAVMIGDQLLTDILGANRTGIDAIWVRPIHQREFFGTRILSRNVERVVGAFLYRNFQADENALSHAPVKSGLFEHNVVREFVKFVAVGFASTVIDLGLHYWLMHSATCQGQPLVQVVGRSLVERTGGSDFSQTSLQQAAFGPLKVGPVILAVLNSFYWNNRWTFKFEDQSGTAKRLTKFFIIALIGMALNVLISSSIYRVAPGGDRVKWAVASVVAMAIVVFWNFAGQKLWTFRK